jgi:putative ABC transport system permease protein
MSGIATRLAQQHPESNANWDVSVYTLREYRTRRFKALSLILFGVVILVLLIACVNVASLLLQRSTERQREIAIRSAIGAGRSRVVIQLLTESVVLGLAGGLFGLLLAFWALKLLVNAIPNELPSYMNNFGIDARVLGFVLLASLITAVVFGLAPALRLSKPNLTEALSDAGARSGGGAGKQRMRNALVVLEVALSLVLLIGAGLMIKSFRQLQAVDPGFDPSHTLTLQVTLPETKYETPEQRTQFIQQAVTRLGALPGVQAAGSTNQLLVRDGLHARFRLEGQTEEERESNPLPGFRLVRGDFFEAAGLSIVRGRSFLPRDQESPPRSVIVSANFAERFWGEEDPIGKRVRIDVTDDDPWLEVVGVTGDLTSLRGRGDEVRYELFVPYPFVDNTAYTGISFVVRTAGDPLSITPAVRDEIRRLDPDLPVVDVQSMEQMLAQSLWLQRITSMLFGVFGAVALILATVGMYGSMAYSFSQRTREIGIRMALGAKAKDVLRMVLRQGFTLVAISVVLGLGGAFGLSRVLQRMLFEVRSTDPVTFVGVTLLVLLISMVAIFIPARRATKIQPVRALRYE